MKKTLVILFLSTISISIQAQIDTSITTIKKYTIESTFLNEEREYWVSLPMNYNEDLAYPVLYILDAQWRFELVRHIAYDLSGNKKMPHHIIVGIPHQDWKKDRGVDFTFSSSRVEYDGSPVDSTVYNNSNSGGAEHFYNFLTQELMKRVKMNFLTNGQNVLIGHSYGGYFGSYISTRNNGFTSFQIYDPSIWFSNGEVIDKIKTYLPREKNLNIFISYQSVPEFHATKIEGMIYEFSKFPNVSLSSKNYRNETHNSLFMYSFLDGMNALYKNWSE